jgi:hypothetical protein
MRNDNKYQLRNAKDNVLRNATDFSSYSTFIKRVTFLENHSGIFEYTTETKMRNDNKYQLRNAKDNVLRK